ncbi:PhoH family protein [Candidatus Bathyarchaeota archaeon]|nr:MAG: PhoH family protein [Candidatus Bathyarchaeota archaeon]
MARRIIKASSSKIVKKTKQRHEFNVKPQTDGQRAYVQSIETNVVTICSGFAGTGKTLLAIGMAMKLYQDKESKFSKIFVVRPAIEACGEQIGYLPGGLSDKMRPLIQPIVDNLRFFIQDEGYISSLLEPTSSNGAPIIEVIPMGYLRGRTFNNCVVVFDEAQNSSPQQMKLFLTRIGKNCKVIIEGDVTQADRFRDRKLNGLFDAIKRLEDCPNVGIVAIEAQDIQRSPIIGPILERYEDVDGV